jgi:cytochrome c
MFMRTVTLALSLMIHCPAVDSEGRSAGDAERGKGLYEQKCTACHSVDANSTGPRHRSVFGRRAGTVEDYRYSLALEDQDFNWNEQTLDAWLADPSAVVPGNLMGMSIRSAQERQDLIAYLKTLK